MADTTAPVLLDFTTKEPRQPVKIDGLVYQMRLPSDLPLWKRQQAMHLGQQLVGPLLALEAGRQLPKPEQHAVSKLLLQVCDMAIGAPPKVLKKLDQADQVILAVTFFERLAPRLRALSALSRRVAHPSNGANGSPASPGSTAATPKSGVRASRSASSKRT